MLTMQLLDGSVLHRESIANYGGDFIPEDDPLTRYSTSNSSDATAVHAAAMALAALVVDAGGRRLARLSVTESAEGIETGWNGLTENGAVAAPGVYFIVPGGFEAVPVIVRLR